MIGYIHTEAERSLGGGGMGQFGIIDNTINRELGRLGERAIERVYAKDVEVVPLGQATLLDVPLSTWLMVAAGATTGAGAGAFLLRNRPVIGATFGGLMGSLFGVAAVALVNRPKTVALPSLPPPGSSMTI